MAASSVVGSGGPGQAEMVAQVERVRGGVGDLVAYIDTRIPVILGHHLHVRVLHFLVSSHRRIYMTRPCI